MAETGRPIGELVEAAQIENADLFVLEQGGVAKSLKGEALRRYAEGAVNDLAWLGQSLSYGQQVTVTKQTVAGVPTIVIGVPLAKNGVDGRDGRDGADSGKIQYLYVFDDEPDETKKYYAAITHISADGTPTLHFEAVAGDPNVWGDMLSSVYDANSTVKNAGGIVAYVDSKLAEIDAALSAAIGGSY